MHIKKLQKSTLIGVLAFSSFLFLGCSSGPEVEYVRVTQFQALEKKIEILQEENKKIDTRYEEFKLKTDEKGDVKKDEESKIRILEESFAAIDQKFLTISEEFSDNKILYTTQIEEIEKILQDLQKVKDHYLKNTQNSENLKSSAPEKTSEKTEKIFDLEAEAEKIRAAQKNTSENEEAENKKPEKPEESEALEKIEEVRVSFEEEKVSGEKTYLIFAKCTGEICEKYLIEKKLFSDASLLPQEKGKEFLISGETKFMGEISGELYFSLLSNLSFEKATPLPKEGVSVFDSVEKNMDNISQ